MRLLRTVAFLLLMATTSFAIDLKVDCSLPNTDHPIRKALQTFAQSNPAGPNTITISGTCHEQIVIRNLPNLTLIGINGAKVVNDASDPNSVSIDIGNSNEVVVNNLHFIGSGAGADCAFQALCRFNNVIFEGAGSDGITIGTRSFAFFVDCDSHDNAGSGVATTVDASLYFSGGRLHDNQGDGLYLGPGSSVHMAYSFLGLNQPVTIDNNAGNGISAFTHGTIRTEDSVNIRNNGGDGIAISGGSAALLAYTNISSNLGHGVRIGDLSILRVGIQNQMAGNAQPDLNCDPLYSIVRGQQRLPTATSNCPVPPPQNP